MLDKKIVYKDPMQKEIAAIIDLTDKSKGYKSLPGKMRGREIQRHDDETTKKVDDLSKKAQGL